MKRLFKGEACRLPATVYFYKTAIPATNMAFRRRESNRVARFPVRAFPFCFPNGNMFAFAPQQVPNC
ncbi:MAG: hypothetical protein LBJ00_09385, partial [Planctomycetaceae bacterium]|nr:hypothetical protein [Planctomycetaceae bacterium]